MEGVRPFNRQSVFPIFEERHECITITVGTEGRLGLHKFRCYRLSQKRRRDPRIHHRYRYLSGRFPRYFGGVSPSLDRSIFKIVRIFKRNTVAVKKGMKRMIPV